MTGCVQPRLRAIVSSTCSECRQHLCTCTVHSNTFAVPTHTEEVSISYASDTYAKVDIEEGMCEDDLLSVWMVFDVTSNACMCVHVCVCVCGVCVCVCVFVLCMHEGYILLVRMLCSCVE